ncbi:MAG: peptidase M16, partial [Candidatus Nephrothrix sp. EaCA]
MLPIPTDKPGNLEKGFRILEDWAHNVTHLAADIDGERPIILEESRMGKGAQERITRKILPHIFAGSLYAKRLPIGKDSIIKNFKHDAIRRFYKDWYRPDLMAVIVVGDITTAKAEVLIHKHFGKLKTNPAARERKYAEFPPYKADDVVVASDKEEISSSVEINFSAFKKEDELTLGDWRKMTCRNLLAMMFNERLQELRQKENPPFTYGSSNFGSMARGYDAFSLYAGAGTGDVKKAAQALTEELKRAEKFGFTATELERSKKRILNDIERSYNNRDKTESGSFVDEYTRYFLRKEPSPGIEYEFEKAKIILPSIKAEEINAFMEQYIKGGGKRCIVVTLPEPKEGENLLTGQEIMDVITAAEQADVKPYEDKAQAEA